MPTNRSFNKLIAGLTRMLAKADSENIRDLEDAIDINGPTATDMFNQNDRGNTPRVTTGPAQSASGSGAERMVSDFSEGAEQTGLSAAYEKFARELADQGKRVESVEKAVSSIAGLISAAMKGDAAAQFGSNSEDDEKENDEDEDTKKGRVHVANVGNVPALMRALSGASQSNGKVGLQTPPNMAVIKSGNEWDNAITDADNRGDHREVLRLSTLRMRQNAAAAGAPVDARLLHGADFQLTPVSLRQPI
jgi:hypothetical protein